MKSHWIIPFALCLVAATELSASSGKPRKENGDDKSSNVTLDRVRRYTTGRFGGCNIIETKLDQGLEILQEVPVQRTIFYIRPRATFLRATLQARLDNIIPFRAAVVYQPRAELSAADLKAMKYKYNADEWIEVIAEVSARQGNWEARLKVGEWTRYMTIRENAGYYSFNDLIISGEGDCEWSFECAPHVRGIDGVDSATGQGGEQPSDEGFWWKATTLVILVTLALFLFVGTCYCFCCRKTGNPIETYMHRFKVKCFSRFIKYTFNVIIKHIIHLTSRWPRC